MDMNTPEEWRDVVGLDSRYKVSNLGRVYSCLTNKILKQSKAKGYPIVNLTYPGPKQLVKNVHCLVCDAFLGPKNGRNVNHIDGSRDNNKLDNLEYVSSRENTNHCRVGGNGKGVHINAAGNIYSRIEIAGAVKYTRHTNVRGAKDHYEAMCQEVGQVKYVRQ